MHQEAKKILKYKDRYVIFYSPWCIYSQKALALLDEKKLPYKKYNIDEYWKDINILLQHLSEDKTDINFNPEHRTRPIIFACGKFIGGYDDLAEKLKK